MEVPAPFAGVVKEMKIKPGDKVSEGAPILSLEVSDGAPAPAPASPAEAGRSGTGAGNRRSTCRAGRQTGARTCDRAITSACGRADRRSRLLQGARQPVGAPLRARTRRRSCPRQRQRAERAHRQGRHRQLREECTGATGRRNRRGCRPGIRTPGLAAGGLCEVRPGRNPADVTDQENFRPGPASQLGAHPARDPERRSRHHRARSLPQKHGRGRAEAGRQAHAAGVDHESRGGGAQDPSRIQFLDRALWRRADPQALLPYRGCRGYAGRSGGPGRSATWTRRACCNWRRNWAR